MIASNIFFATDTASGFKKSIKTSGPINLYVCGITPYDFAHLGHGRCYVTFDVLVRLLRYFGHTVIYARNYTDIDDKLINRACREYGDPAQYLQVANRFIEAFEEDMALLHVLEPDHAPRVTQMMPEIIRFIEQLIATGHAYEVGGDVYYQVRSNPHYGSLSGRNIDELRIGARIAIRDDKRDPLDFALWKAEKTGTFFESPWGWGRPGWHIECSAMTKHYLGNSIDIHGGGMDLIFPHHENELAQSQVLQAEPFVHIWMHNAFVQINKEKMSKSLGNFFTLRDLFREHDPEVVRFYFLQHHYRSPIDFNREHLLGVAQSLNRISRLLNPDNRLAIPDLELKTADEIKLFQSIMKPLLDDLNIPGFLGEVHKNMNRIQQHDIMREKIAYVFQSVLGITLIVAEPKTTITPEIQKLIDARQAARAERDFSRADALRQQLEKLGISVHDKPIESE